MAVSYRPGSEVITQAFYTELAKLLGYMALFASPFIVTGDLNIRFDRPEDAATAKVNDLLTSYGAAQHIVQPTHVRGGILDVVITSAECLPGDVTVDDPGLSDHSLVQWRFDLRLSSEPVHVERQRRLWRNSDLTSFRTALTTSCLCDPASLCTMINPTSVH